MQYTWELSAKRNDPMPDGLSLTEQMAYQTLAELTARYKMGAVSAEQAKHERQELDRAFVIRLAGDNAAKWMTDFRAKIEIAHDRYRLNPTAENAEVLSKVIDGFVRI